MKCINKWICLSLLIAVSCVSGCGKTSAAIEQPYDVYATAADFGLSSNGTAEAKSYFASNLCVSEDVAIGTDSTDSQVAEGAGTFNLETNTVVYAKNLYERLYPASTTKILTAYIALKYCDDLDAMVTVSENAVNQASDSSVCNLKAGDVIRLRDLLYGLMLRSGNDAAVAIAEHVSGSVEAFAEKIGAEIGCTRPVAEEEKLLPRERYIGVSGVSVRPRLYIAAGISGQIQHMVGVSDSETIIAINKDKQAPIFKNCDFGVVGDAVEVIAALTARL